MSWSSICLIWSEADMADYYSAFLVLYQRLHKLVSRFQIPHHILFESEMMTFSISLQYCLLCADWRLAFGISFFIGQKVVKFGMASVNQYKLLEDDVPTWRFKTHWAKTPNQTEVWPTDWRQKPNILIIFVNLYLSLTSVWQNIS